MPRAFDTISVAWDELAFGERTTPMGAHAADRQDCAALLQQNEWDFCPVDGRFRAQKLAWFQRIGARHHLKLVDRWLKRGAVDVGAHAKNHVAAQPGGQAREEQTNRG